MAATTDRQRYALQTIFSFFLGLMVLAFVGVGVNTFYPSPTEQHQKEQQAISRKMEALNVKTTGSLNATQQAEMTRLQNQQNALQDTIDTQMKAWARTTSIILVVFATIVMGISLIRSEQLKVISNGLLLGGLFTMLYGVGWVIFSGNSTARFFVISFALLVTIGLGYAKFVRERAATAQATAGVSAGVGLAPGAVADAGALAELSARLDALEARTAAAAAALGTRDAHDEEHRA